MTVDPKALPTLLLVRHPIPGDGIWPAARSWLGGRPVLGPELWPRTASGEPMQFVAQIDLAEVSVAAGETGLPAAGALAVFLGHDGETPSGSVLHVPDGAGGLADPPGDMPPLGEYPGDKVHEDPARPRPRIHRFRPVGIVSLGPLDREDADGVAAAVAAHPGLVPDPFPSRERLKTLPVFWHAAQAFAADWRLSLLAAPDRRAQMRARVEMARSALAALNDEARKEQGILGRLLKRPPSPKLQRRIELESARLDRQSRMLADLENGMPGTGAWVAELERWAGSHEPWEEMDADDIARFDAELARSRKEYGDVRGASVRTSRHEYALATLHAMAGGPPEAIVALPPDLRAEMGAGTRLPNDPPLVHQMFGRGADIQGAVMEHEGAVMLLQLVYDTAMGWRWGDVGAYQFWMTPEDFAAGNFSRVTVTFEGH